MKTILLLNCFLALIHLLISVPPSPPWIQCRFCFQCETDTNERGLCKCDADCMIYGDCCGPQPSQTPTACEGQNVSFASLVERPLFTCESIHVDDEAEYMGERDAFWMVSTCSPGWLNEVGESGRNVFNSCTSKTRDLPPVTDNITSIVYKNQRCALCNNVEKTIPWQSNLVCSTYLNQLINSDNFSISVININLLQKECNTSLYLQPRASSPRSCFPAINTCLDRNALALLNYTYTPQEYEALINDCLNGPYNLQTNRDSNMGRIYRNQACANCNGVFLLKCYRPFGGFIPFSIVLSNFGAGQVSIRFKTETLVTNINCPDGQAPFGLECRDTLCPVDFIAIDGRCFYQSNSSKNISVLDCPTELVQLRESEFVLISNNTVMLTDGREKTVYGYSEVGGLPLVCPDTVTTREVNSTSFLYPAGFIELTYIGCSLSVIGSALVLITYGLFKELRSLPSKILMNLAFANLVTNLLILIGGPVSQAFPIAQLCTTVAILLHFFFLAQFSWMSVMSFEVVRKFHQAKKFAKDSNRQKTCLLFIYILVGWGVPILTATVTIIINFTMSELVLYGVLADGSLGICWINHLESAVIAFVIPLVLSLSFNLLMFSIVIVYNVKASRAQAKLKKQQNIPFFSVTLTVFSVTGLTWIFGFLAILASASWAWYLFIIINSTQGFVIFIAFLFKRKILKLYRNLPTRVKEKITIICCVEKKAKVAKTKSTSTTSTSVVVS